MPVITISRTLGSGGSEVGRLLARRLKYRYFDREELEGAARRRKYLRADVDVLDEKSVPLFESLFLDKPKEYLAFLHDAICDAAEEDNLVLVGRGGQAILRDLATAFHVRLDAPLDVRVSRVMERLNLDEAQARRRIKEEDNERARFVEQAFGVDWADPMHYHLVVNTGLMDLETAAKVILQGFRQIRWKERQEGAKGFLQKYRLVKAIRTELIRHPQITCPSCVDVQCDDQNVVTLRGRLTEPHEKAVIENVVRKVRGVARVVNELKP